MRSELPSNSILKLHYADYAYKDTFEVAISRQDVANWELIAALFCSAPPWFDVLAKLRDRMVSVFGLKTSAGDPKRLPPPYLEGQEIGFFRVLEQADREVILGNDDKHLNFRTSLMVTQKDDGAHLCVSTVVSTKNLLGTVYFGIVKYAHRLIVPIMARGMARIIDSRALPEGYYESMKK